MTTIDATPLVHRESRLERDRAYYQQQAREAQERAERAQAREAQARSLLWAVIVVAAIVVVVMWLLGEEVARG